MESALVSPYGGELKNLLAAPEQAAELQAASRPWPSWDLTWRQLSDLELLLHGGFSPLTGFLNQADYQSVCRSQRLKNGVCWPVPVILDITEAAAEKLAPGTPLALRDPEGVLLAVLHVESIWKADRRAEAEQVYGTADPAHWGVDYLLRRTHPVYVGGRVEGIQAPLHYDWRSLRRTPAQVRRELDERGWSRVLAFQPRRIMHRAALEMSLRVMRDQEANLLLHPVVGDTAPDVLEHYARIRSYQALLPHYLSHSTLLSLLPLAPRFAGPREAVWQAIVGRNYGCSHFLVGPDHASAGAGLRRAAFYAPLAAQDLLRDAARHVGVEPVPFAYLAYSPERARYLTPDEVREGERTLMLSETELQQSLDEGSHIPDWFSFPEVLAEARRLRPPRRTRGFTLFFTGLSGSGKSSIARVLLVKLMEIGDRPVTLLDGDLVRKHLSAGLGFSREDRNLNVRRIGFVASEITKNGGAAICAPIAPYDSIRREVRETIENHGGFILIHVSTPLELCEQRDRKGLYAKARAGEIPEFTGVSDPYEAPTDAELVIDTAQCTVEQACQRILLHLESEGYLGGVR